MSHWQLHCFTTAYPGLYKRKHQCLVLLMSCDRWIPLPKGHQCRKRFYATRQHGQSVVVIWYDTSTRALSGTPLIWFTVISPLTHRKATQNHYADVIMIEMASQITSLAIVYSIVYSDADQRKHQSSASLAFVRRIHRGPVNSPHKWPVTRKMFPFDDVIMRSQARMELRHEN